MGAGIISYNRCCRIYREVVQVLDIWCRFMVTFCVSISTALHLVHRTSAQVISFRRVSRVSDAIIQ